jgi:uncharacterized protein YjiS (DUF1127 family)
MTAMTFDSTAPFDWSAYRTAIASGSRGRAREAMRLLRRWYEVNRERQALAGLDERALKDIGLSRTDALEESARPFWDATPRRRFD